MKAKLTILAAESCGRHVAIIVAFTPDETYGGPIRKCMRKILKHLISSNQS
jgi:hypothetical protein